MAEKKDTTYVKNVKEYNAKDLLKWRPGRFTKEVPELVYETRMSLLDLPDRKLLEDEFAKCGPKHKLSFFGESRDLGGYGENGWKLDAITCFCSANEDVETGMRLFKASANFDGVRDKDGQWCLKSDGTAVQFDAGKPYRDFMNVLKEYSKETARKAAEMASSEKSQPVLDR